jgi:protein-ribulosamine 3-kinase
MEFHRVQEEFELNVYFRRSLNECYKFSCETASFFVKINRSFSAREMFEGEAGSLQALRFAGMNAPAPLKVGDLPHGGSYLIMDHVAFEPDLMLEPSSQAKLGEAIAQMHLHQPERHQFFGFGLPTRLGTVEMENKFCASWAEFFVESRLRTALESVGDKKCQSAILVDRAEEICEKASGMLREIDETIRPSVLHGDLWYPPCPLLSFPLLSFPLHPIPLNSSSLLFIFSFLLA